MSSGTATACKELLLSGGSGLSFAAVSLVPGACFPTDLLPWLLLCTRRKGIGGIAPIRFALAARISFICRLRLALDN
jgi:hypothetical protein